jgi:hypothetical protein
MRAAIIHPPREQCENCKRTPGIAGLQWGGGEALPCSLIEHPSRQAFPSLTVSYLFLRLSIVSNMRSDNIEFLASTVCWPSAIKLYATEGEAA